MEVLPQLKIISTLAFVKSQEALTALKKQAFGLQEHLLTFHFFFQVVLSDDEDEDVPIARLAGSHSSGMSGPVTPKSSPSSHPTTTAKRGLSTDNLASSNKRLRTQGGDSRGTLQGKSSSDSNLQRPKVDVDVSSDDETEYIPLAQYKDRIKLKANRTSGPSQVQPSAGQKKGPGTGESATSSSLDKFDFRLARQKDKSTTETPPSGHAAQSRRGKAATSSQNALRSFGKCHPCRNREPHHSSQPEVLL